MRNFIIIAIVIGAGYFGYQHFGSSATEQNDEVILYSLSYCGYCKKLAQELEASGIEFVEYYVDKDRAKADELNQKLRTHKVPGGSIKMPVVDLGDVLLPNRPSLSEVEHYFE